MSPTKSPSANVVDVNTTSAAPTTELDVKVDPIVEAHAVRDESRSSSSPPRETVPVPLSWKLMSVVLVTCIGFGSQWSSGVTGAMKSTIKKELHINNTQFSLLEASEDFMVTALMLLSGIVTDRVGGAGSTFASALRPQQKLRLLQAPCSTEISSTPSARFSSRALRKLALTSS